MKTTSQLKQIVARRAAVQAPGTANALFARVIEELGFEVVYVTGAGIEFLRRANDGARRVITHRPDIDGGYREAADLPLAHGHVEVVNRRGADAACGGERPDDPARRGLDVRRRAKGGRPCQPVNHVGRQG